MSTLHDYVAFVAIDQGDLYRLRADGSEFTRLTTNLGVSGSDIFTVTPTLSPDGVWLAFVVGTAHHSDIFVIRPDGRDLRHVSSASGSKFDLYWSPDSRYLAFANEKPSWNATLYTVHISTWQVEPLIVNLDFPLHPWYTPLLEDQHPMMEIEDHRLAEPLWIPPGKSFVAFPPLGDGYVLGWLRKNTHVLFRTLLSAELFIIDILGEAFYPWQPAVAKPHVVGARPDGQVVAYQAYGGNTLYLHHLDEGKPRAISHDYSDYLYFSDLKWSPDGRYLAYNVHHHFPNHSQPGPTMSVHIATLADGTTLTLGRGTAPHWLPDGSHLTFSRMMHPRLSYPIQPVRYDLATAITTPLIEEIAEMELSPWYWMPGL